MRIGDSFSRSNDFKRGVSEITLSEFTTRLLVILQRVYILGPRTNLTWRSSHGESKEEGQKESFEKEVRPSTTASVDNLLARRTSKLQTVPAYAGTVASGRSDSQAAMPRSAYQRSCHGSAYEFRR